MAARPRWSQFKVSKLVRNATRSKIIIDATTQMGRVGARDVFRLASSVTVAMNITNADTPSRKAQSMGSAICNRLQVANVMPATTPENSTAATHCLIVVYG